MSTINRTDPLAGPVPKELFEVAGPCPVTVQYDAAGDLHLTAEAIGPDEMAQYGREAVRIARALVADDERHEPLLHVEVVVSYM